LRTEVPLGTRHGVNEDSVANCHNILTIPKSSLGRQRGRLGAEDLMRLNDALRIALELD
jgi:mRNA-degrading endonuclease toxin of MazEF toxin-antitoxin module